MAIKLDYLLITSRRQASKNMTNESNFKKHLPERFLKEQYPVTAHAPNFFFGQDVAKSKDARTVREP